MFTTKNTQKHCKHCGRCCTDVLLLTEAEINAIKKRVKQQKLTNHTPRHIGNERVETCPFLDVANNTCDIYDIRPQICQNFYCYKTTMDTLPFDKLKPVNMIKTFFPGEYSRDTSKMEEELLQNISVYSSLIKNLNKTKEHKKQK